MLHPTYTPHLHYSISDGESDDSELQVLPLPLDTLRYLARAHQLLCTGREASSCDGLQWRGRPSEGAARYLRQGCAYAGQTHFFLIYVLLLRGSALFFVTCLSFSSDARPQSLKSFSLHAQVCFRSIARFRNGKSVNFLSGAAAVEGDARCHPPALR